MRCPTIWVINERSVIIQEAGLAIADVLLEADLSLVRIEPFGVAPEAGAPQLEYDPPKLVLFVSRLVSAGTKGKFWAPSNSIRRPSC
jgi:hypothetical protein